MPLRPGKACRSVGCPNVVRNGQHQGYCEQHKSKSGWFANEQQKGNRHQRGYGSVWNKLREQCINANRVKYSRLYKSNPFNFKVESMPNMNGKPLEGFCERSFELGIIRKGSDVDHRVSKANGGDDSLNNLQVLSTYYHKIKTSTERS